jgi:predicted GTPase
MSRWRLAILLGLLLLPILFLIGAGSWYFWREGLWFRLWWPMAGCWTLALLLAWWWQRQAKLIPGPDFTPSLHWTERDREAWKLIEARARGVKDIPPSRFLEFQFYIDLARDMGRGLAGFYHPKAADPVAALTIPEILAVAELASHDLAEMVDDYLPGGHMLTVHHWRNAYKVSEWYTRASNAYWAISAIFSPINTALRYGASKLGMSRPFQLLQENLLAWFYTAYVHRVGTYLIELNSGRLRVGARRYRELVARAQNESGVAAPESGVKPDRFQAPDGAARAPDAVAETSLTLIGQVKAGKSSVANGLLGERLAATDVLPLTSEITRYQLNDPDVGSKLVILDTVGYAHAGPKADQLRATQEALQQSDLGLLVLHARDPARQPDLEMLKALREYFQARPYLKTPRILGVLTHIDLLSPMMEWSPPYDWIDPRRPKEKSIHDAVAAAEEQLGSYLVGVVPICAAEGKVFGVKEWLLPRIVQLLDEARAVALLRCLHAEADAGKVRKLFEQILQAGKQLVRAAVRGPASSRTDL